MKLAERKIEENVYFVLVLVYTQMMTNSKKSQNSSKKNHIIVLSFTCLLDFDKMRLLGLTFVLYFKY